MPWFRVDDSFYDHPKALAAGPALALWLRAGCYCARHLTDGYVSRESLRLLGGTPAMAKRLVDAKAKPDGAGLWLVVEGGWRFHDWDRYQPSRATVEERRRTRSEAGRIGGKASGAARKGEANDEANRSPVASRTFEPPARPGPARPGSYLLTLVSRLAAGDAHDGQPPAGEVIASWQELAGPDVDLEAEALAYLQRFGDRPADDERGAWLGWLRTARRRAETRPPTRSPCSRPDCRGGWLDAGDNDTPVPCPTCKPHLRPVPQPEAS